jgi:rhodanese-related sulfurtransferase
MSVSTISPAGLSERRRTGQSCDLIDVRTPVEYREMHVEFARNVPLDQLDPEAVMGARNGNSAEPLYVICQMGGRGQKACEAFQKKGFANVVNVEGGTKACEQTYLPLIRGKKAISIERQVRIVAGSLVLIGVILGTWVHPYLYGLSAFIGAGLLFAGISDTCGMGIMLSKMPWNK